MSSELLTWSASLDLSEFLSDVEMVRNVTDDLLPNISPQDDNILVPERPALESESDQTFDDNFQVVSPAGNLLFDDIETCDIREKHPNIGNSSANFAEIESLDHQYDSKKAKVPSSEIYDMEHTTTSDKTQQYLIKRGRDKKPRRSRVVTAYQPCLVLLGIMYRHAYDHDTGDVSGVVSIKTLKDVLPNMSVDGKDKGGHIHDLHKKYGYIEPAILGKRSGKYRLTTGGIAFCNLDENKDLIMKDINDLIQS